MHKSSQDLQLEERHGELSRESFKDVVGICTQCREHCSVLDPCCGAPVHFEGAYYSIDDFEGAESLEGVCGTRRVVLVQRLR